MNGRAHLLSAVFVILPSLLAFFSQAIFSLPEFLLACVAIVLGVLAPDVDQTTSYGARSAVLGVGSGKTVLQQLLREFDKLFTQVFAKVSRWFFYEPLVLFLHAAGHRNARAHRGVMHSFFAAVLCAAFWTMVLLAGSYASGTGPQLAFVFGGSLLVGFLFHLYCDSLTPTGVNWAFPHEMVLHGRIKTGAELYGRGVKFFESQLFALCVFALIGSIVSWLLLYSRANAVFLALLTVFCLLVAAVALGLEVHVDSLGGNPHQYLDLGGFEEE